VKGQSSIRFGSSLSVELKIMNLFQHFSLIFPYFCFSQLPEFAFTSCPLPCPKCQGITYLYWLMTWADKRQRYMESNDLLLEGALVRAGHLSLCPLIGPVSSDYRLLTGKVVVPCTRWSASFSFPHLLPLPPPMLNSSPQTHAQTNAHTHWETYCCSLCQISDGETNIVASWGRARLFLLPRLPKTSGSQGHTGNHTPALSSLHPGSQHSISTCSSETGCIQTNYTAISALSSFRLLDFVQIVFSMSFRVWFIGRRLLFCLIQSIASSLPLVKTKARPLR